MLALALRAPRVDAAYSTWSILSPIDPATPPPDDELLDLAINIVQGARSADLSHLAHRVPEPFRYLVHQWPGEHYRLLAAVSSVVQPSLAVEVGTFWGLGTLAIADAMPVGGRVVTYDVIPWRDVPEAVLDEGDADRIDARVGDLSDPAYFRSQADVLAAAEIIFLDGPKDGRFERTLLDLLLPVVAQSRPLLIFDDIRVLTMLDVWRDLPLSKLDLTSFGHWTGTGIARVR